MHTDRKSLLALGLFFLLPGLLTVYAAGDSVPSGGPDFLGLPHFETGSALTNRTQQIEQMWLGGKRHEALRAVESWKKEEKQSPYPWVVEASFEYRDKRYKRCLSLCDKALKLSPQCAAAFYWKGRAYEEMDKLLEAANEYRAAVKAEASYQLAQEALNRVLFKLGPEESTNG